MRRLALASLLAFAPALPAQETPAPPAPAAPKPAAAAPLSVEEVLAGVAEFYPPYLAALIEQDIVNGRARQARGAFDTTLNLSGTFRPDGYYDGTTAGAFLEQPLPFWGGSVYGGYRLSSGFLPNYNKERTPDDGQIVFGLKVPLLRDGTIDARRVRLRQAELDQQLADPVILRQRLDYIRAATIAYRTWVAMGHRLRLAEEILRVAEARDAAIAEQIARGASAPIVRVDNRRLVIARRIALVQATRRFEAAAIELSLFHRDRTSAEPVRPGRDRLPPEFPAITPPDPAALPGDIAKAFEARPELRRCRIDIDKARLDERLADNAILPDLSVGAQVNQSPSGARSKDIERTELEARVELRVPLERNEAKGRLQAAKAMISRLELESGFARDRIAADVRDSFSALVGAAGQIAETGQNVELARELLAAEEERFRQGASDLLALQIREQAAFEARILDVEARADYFRALANYRAATAADAPAFDAAAQARIHDFHPDRPPAHQSPAAKSSGP